MSLPQSHIGPDKDEKDSDSVVSESEFEQEMPSQEDICTPSTVHLECGGSLQPCSTSDNRNSVNTSSSRSCASANLNSDISATDSGEETSATSPPTGRSRFHARILLLLPLLYLASTPTLPWALQTTAQVLLAFVLLTLAVRLTSTPPQVFSRAASELGAGGLKQMLRQQSQLFLAQTQPPDMEEHAPASQSALGSTILVLIFVSLSYLQTSGSLQQIVRHMTASMPLPSPAGEASSTVCLNSDIPAKSSLDNSHIKVYNYLDTGKETADAVTSFFSSSQSYIRQFLGIDGSPVTAAAAADDVPVVAVNDVRRTDVHEKTSVEETITVEDFRGAQGEQKRRLEQQEQEKTKDEVQQKQREQKQKQKQDESSRGGEQSLPERKERASLSVPKEERRGSVMNPVATASAASDATTEASTLSAAAVATATASVAEKKGGKTVHISENSGIVDSSSSSGGSVSSNSETSQSKDSSSTSTGASDGSNYNKGDGMGMDTLHHNSLSSDRPVHVSVNHYSSTPYGTGFLMPEENLTFCGSAPPPRPSESVWRRMNPLRSRDKSAPPISPHMHSVAVPSTSSKHLHCEVVQILTFSHAGLVVIQQLDKGSNDSTPATLTETVDETPSNANASSLNSTKEKSTNSGRNMPSVVWKGNYFPLWQRMLKKLKPLPTPKLAYSFAENNLTIWRLKKISRQQPKMTAEEGDAKQDVGTNDDFSDFKAITRRHYKQWKVFKVVRGWVLR